MKKVKAKLQAIRESIQEKIDQRESVFYDRSDEWQESEKGIDYEDKTSELETVIDTIDIAIDEMDIYLGI